jgi:DNA-directed RNA polymerase specialized sigma24 family protein
VTERSVFDSAAGVVRALVTYTDWWQPSSGSVIQTGGARRASNVPGDGIPGGLLDSLDDRAELCRRMAVLDAQGRRVLFLWYVRQLAVDDIARELEISRRQCFRRRAAAVRAITDDGIHSSMGAVA